MISALEVLRLNVTRKLLEQQSVNQAWPRWRAEIKRNIGTTPSSQQILDIGDHLRSIFQTTSRSERSQSSVSTGGYAWEALVCIYLNMCLAGSRTVVTKELNSFVPKQISEAKTIKYGSFRSNTETDLVAITFPSTEFFVEKTHQKNRDFSRQLLAQFESELEDKMHVVSVCVIQCKTNWNDNAQIPMLWDMIYRAQGFAEASNISIGTNNHTIEDLRSFSYAFVTVPSQRDISKFKPNSTACKRVGSISGGNYWGCPSRDSVANSLKEIFTRNFKEGLGGHSVRASLNRQLESNHDIFNILDIL